MLNSNFFSLKCSNSIGFIRNIFFLNQLSLKLKINSLVLPIEWEDHPMTVSMKYTQESLKTTQYKSLSHVTKFTKNSKTQSKDTTVPKLFQGLLSSLIEINVFTVSKNSLKPKLSSHGIHKQLILISKIKHLLEKEESLLLHSLLVHNIISVMVLEFLLIILDKMLDSSTILKIIWKMKAIKKFGTTMVSIDIYSIIMVLMLEDLEVIQCIWPVYRIHQNFLVGILWHH